MNEWNSVFSTLFDVGISLCITRQGIEFLRGWAQNRTGVRQNQCLIVFIYSLLVPVWKNRDHNGLIAPGGCKHWIKPDKELSSVPDVQRAFRELPPKSQPKGRTGIRGIFVLWSLFLTCLMKRCPGVLQRLGCGPGEGRVLGSVLPPLLVNFGLVISPLRALRVVTHVLTECLPWAE